MDLLHFLLYVCPRPSVLLCWEIQEHKSIAWVVASTPPDALIAAAARYATVRCAIPQIAVLRHQAERAHTLGHRSIRA